MKLLDNINRPQDLHNLDDGDLITLAEEIRTEIIDVTSQCGGHVASSLGAVEIILAVHSLINSPQDAFVFDVGHQSYTHKIITGRREQFKKIRKIDGISGFTAPAESEHDFHYSGHASDSLSIALGLARAKKAKGEPGTVIALIGDASIAGGMAFEALNQIGREKLPLVVILNDNYMSISPSVGGFMNHLRNIRLDSRYKSARRNTVTALKRLGFVGDVAIKAGHASKSSIKHLLMPHSIMFEELGITCVSLIDGHNITELKRSIGAAIESKSPVLIHVVTEKGYGFSPAWRNPELYHGIGPYDLKTGIPKLSTLTTYTKVFSKTLIDLAKKDKKIFALTAAMAGGTGLKDFNSEYPDRFIDVGIAEEHLIGMAAGLAKGGLKPVVAVYSAFLQRAVDQLITNVAIDSLNVCVCVDRAGLVGADGVSHHGMFDMVYGRMIPNFTVLAPSCDSELRSALNFALNTDGPFMIRYPKGECFNIDNNGNILKSIPTDKISDIEYAKSRTLKDGNDVSILAFGDCVIDSLTAHDLLKNIGINARVVDMRFVNPLDIDAIKSAYLDTKCVITVENGIKKGGLGEAVLSEMCSLGLDKPIHFKSIGIDDQFVGQGSIEKLKSQVNIDAESIYQLVISELQKIN